MHYTFTGINHTTLLVKDKEKSFDFYHNVLGFEKYEKTKSLWLVAGNQFVHISDSSGESVEHSFYHFAVLVDEFESFLAHLRGKNIAMFVLDSEGDLMKSTDFDSMLSKQQVFVRDLDGNLIEFLDNKNSYFNPG